MKALGSKDFWLGAFRSDSAAFRSAVAEAPLDAPVPSCPEWTVGDLISHLGAVYGRMADVVGRADTTRPERSIPDFLAPSGTDLRPWFDERRQALLGLFDGLDPEQPAWNWAPQAKKAVFWHRRMAHETAVHRWDAQMAATGLAEPIEAKLASDGITEVLDTWLPAGRRRGSNERSGMIALHATDLEQVWYVRLRGAGVALLDTDTLLDSDDHHERATASGSASDVVLALYGRISYEALTVGGDLVLLEGLRVG